MMIQVVITCYQWLCYSLCYNIHWDRSEDRLKLTSITIETINDIKNKALMMIIVINQLKSTTVIIVFRIIYLLYRREEYYLYITTGKLHEVSNVCTLESCGDSRELYRGVCIRINYIGVRYIINLLQSEVSHWP